MSKADDAVAIFDSSFSCSQSVLDAFAGDFGLDSDTALKIACGFGGGMGRMGGVCGALTGAYMVLGLQYSAGELETVKTKSETYKIVKEFTERFKERNGHITCTDLLGIDISTQEGHDQAQKQKLFTTRCPVFVRDAAALLEEIL